MVKNSKNSCFWAKNDQKRSFWLLLKQPTYVSGPVQKHHEKTPVFHEKSPLLVRIHVQKCCLALFDLFATPEQNPFWPDLVKNTPKS